MSILGAIGGLAGSVVDGLFGDSAADKQADLQMEFAKNGIRWKVKDAIKSGIHPLYALGAQTTSYQPVSVGGTDFANAGQNIGSAIHAMTTPKEKSDGFHKTVQGLTLEKMGLENEVLRSQLRLIDQPGRGPGMPGPALIDGQGSTSGKVYHAGGTGGLSIEVNPANTPAQKIEDQYSEIPANVAGTLNVVDDMMRTQKMPYPHEVPAIINNIVDKAVKAAVAKYKPPRSARGYGGY